MASSAKKIKIKNLPKIETDVYSMIGLNNLVVYAVHYLQEYEVTASVEEIVSICFRLFPRSFALKNYPHWPDSALVIRRLNDAREKENLKGNSMDGFSLKYKGKLLAKRVAKLLGLVQSAPAKTKKKIAPTQPVKVQAKRTRIILQKKKVIAPKSTQLIKQETLPLIRAKKFPAPVPVKKANKQTQSPAAIKKKQHKQSVIKTALSKQLTLGFLTAQEKKINPIAQVSKKKREVIAPVVLIHVSKEEKAKAGKFVHSMERSDAYIQYKKNGNNSKIGEFDFRSLLLCTMETSRETLIKNMNLFKGYAGIHNRQDLIVFLSFCEDKFSYLLKPQNKPVRKAKK